jgi:transcription elongation GreA/GreB family factor
MRYYFFREDLRALEEQLEAIKKRVGEIGKEMGESCEEGAETFHDNFTYEEGERQQIMLTKRYSELNSIRQQAIIVAPEPNQGRVAMGRTITIENEETGTQQIFKIGSYRVAKELDENGIRVISYDAPLAKAFIGKQQDDEGTCFIRGKKNNFIIVKIE